MIMRGKNTLNSVDIFITFSNKMKFKILGTSMVSDL